MSLFLDIAQGEHVTIGEEGPDQVVIRADRKDRKRIRLGLTMSSQDQVEIKIGGERIICGAQEEGRRVQLKLDADRSIPIEMHNHQTHKIAGSGGPTMPQED